MPQAALASTTIEDKEVQLMHTVERTSRHFQIFACTRRCLSVVLNSLCMHSHGDWVINASPYFHSHHCSCIFCLRRCKTRGKQSLWLVVHISLTFGTYVIRQAWTLLSAWGSPVQPAHTNTFSIHSETAWDPPSWPHMHRSCVLNLVRFSIAMRYMGLSLCDYSKEHIWSFACGRGTAA
jgi:hypothetical protein